MLEYNCISKCVKLKYLEYGRSVWRSPCVQQIILAGRDKPLAAGGKLKAEHAALVQMQLVLLRFGGMQDLDV